MIDSLQLESASRSRFPRLTKSTLNLCRSPPSAATAAAANPGCCCTACCFWPTEPSCRNAQCTVELLDVAGSTAAVCNAKATLKVIIFGELATNQCC
jgi:hypothetical protein